MSLAAAEEHAAERRPALAPWYRRVQDADRLLLEHGGSVVTLEGRAASRLLPALVPLLDGRRTVGEIVGALGAAAEPAVRRALDLLDRHGLLIDERGGPLEDADGHAEAARFASACSSGRVAPSAAAARLGAARVAVAGSSAAAGEIARLLGDAGVGLVRRLPISELPGELDLLVAAPAREETALLAAANDRALARRLSWLQLLPHDGRFGVIGPLFLPGESACHDCYRMRRAAGSDYEEDFDLIEREPTRAPEPAALAAIAAGLTALLAVRWLATADASIPGRAYTVATRTVLELASHRVLRVPRCPACGTGAEALASPWYKEASRDG